MATQYNEFQNISALNWRVHYLDYLDSERVKFNEICYFEINEFVKTDVIKIERKINSF